jgi:hypothetical protein
MAPDRAARPDPAVPALDDLTRELAGTTWLANSARPTLANAGARRRRRRVLTPPPFRYPGVRTAAVGAPGK